jgi:hypothetical protein
MDLSGVDAELDGLGAVPQHAVALARDFAGMDVSLSELELLDQELALLAESGSAPVTFSTPRAVSVAPAHDAHASDDQDDWQAQATYTEREPELDEVDAREQDFVASDAAPEPAAPFHVLLARGAARVDSDVAPVNAELASDDDLEGEPLPERTLTSRPPPELNESWPPLAAAEAPPAFDAPEPPSAVHSVPPPAPPLTQSQEIVLPDPIPRDELSSESGELLLDDEKPSSGSFSLDDETGPVTRPPPAARPRGLSEFAAADDVGDALEGSEPISFANRASQSKAPGFPFDRDPDAEFDALLSEATDPNGMPTDAPPRAADDLLQGLDDDLHEDLATSEFAVDERAELDSVATATDELGLLLEDLEDSTEILDRESLDAIHAAAPASTTPARADARGQAEDILAEEFDASDLEIVMEEEEAPTKAPPPPPPAPSSGPEKRPSGFLGRFFGRERE